MIDLSNDDFIIVVRPSKRACGIGESMVNHAIKRVVESGDKTLWHFQIAPVRAASFWAKLGFNVYKNSRDEIFGWQKFDKPLPPLPEGRHVEVIIRFWSPNREYFSSCEKALCLCNLFKSVKLNAIITAEGEVFFPTRVQLHVCECLTQLSTFGNMPIRDIAIEFLIDGHVIFIDKPTYEVKSIGIRENTNGIIIDKLSLTPYLLSRVPVGKQNDTTSIQPQKLEDRRRQWINPYAVQ